LNGVSIASGQLDNLAFFMKRIAAKVITRGVLTKYCSFDQQLFKPKGAFEAVFLPPLVSEELVAGATRPGASRNM
jgi:hypothetical protein